MEWFMNKIKDLNFEILVEFNIKPTHIIQHFISSS